MRGTRGVVFWARGTGAAGPPIPPTGTSAPRRQWQLYTRGSAAHVFWSYGARSAVQADQPLTWITRSAVQADLALAWETGGLTSVYSDSPIAWITRSAVVRDRTLSWSVLTTGVPPRVKLSVRYTRIPTFTTRVVR